MLIRENLIIFQARELINEGLNIEYDNKEFWEEFVKLYPADVYFLDSLYMLHSKAANDNEGLKHESPKEPKPTSARSSSGKPLIRWQSEGSYGEAAHRPARSLLNFSGCQTTGLLNFKRSIWAISRLNFGRNRHCHPMRSYTLGPVLLSGPRPSPTRIPYWIAYRDVLRAAWACGFADAYVVRLLNVPTYAEDAEDFFKEKAAPISRTRTLEVRTPHRFQHDILTLVRSTWRAKTCELKSCSQPFVADEPARRFCPERYVADPEFSCYKQYRREYKRDLWKKRGEKWRAATKSKGSRRTRRAKRR